MSSDGRRVYTAQVIRVVEVLNAMLLVGQFGDEITIEVANGKR